MKMVNAPDTVRAGLLTTLVYCAHPAERVDRDGNSTSLLIHARDPDLNRPDVRLVGQPVQEVVVVCQPMAPL